MKGKILKTILAVLSCACLSFGVAACGMLGGFPSFNSSTNSTNSIENNSSINSENSQGGGSSAYSKDLAYIISEDKTYYIVYGIGLCADRDILIPDSYLGLPVKEIGDNAFKDMGNRITSVAIPNTVTTIGKYAFYNCTNLTSVVIPNGVMMINEYAFEYCSNLTEVEIPDSVTTIGRAAFSGCKSLTSVVIPDSVTSIDDYAFHSCTSLTNVYITDIVAWCNISFDGSYANPLSYANNLYLNNEFVTELVIPDDVTLIGSYAFSGCKSLMCVEIPDSVTTIGYGAFEGCDNLTSVYISNIASWCNISFASDNANPLYYASNLCLNDEVVTELVIPNSVTEIKRYAFYHYDNMESVVIPYSVTKIGQAAFFGCNNLTNIEIPDSVTTIGEYAFQSCDSLASAILPAFAISYIPKKNLQTVVVNSGDSIGDWVFSDVIPVSNSSLISVAIGDSVTTIGDYAFSGCISLTSITVDERNTVYKSVDGNLYSKDGTILIRYAAGKTDTDFIIPDGVISIGVSAFSSSANLTTIGLPNSITTISDEAFYSCTSLASIVIPDGVTTIGNYAFSGCDSLTSVVIPDSVTTIDGLAFAWCDSLTSVIIGDGVTTIGEYAFRECTSLTSVVIGDSVTTIGSYAFLNCTSLTSVYYKGTAEEWSGITIGYNNYSLTSATRYYYIENEADVPTDGGNYWHYDKNGEIAVW